MDVNKYMLRAARDTLMDQLSLARIFPIADLPVQPEQRIVPYNNYNYIIVEYSQPDVHYEVYDNENRKVGEADGNGGTLKIQTGKLINEDYTFSVKAFKVGYSKQLLQTATVKIGVDTGLSVALKAPVIDFNTAAIIIVSKAQSNTQYEVSGLKGTSLGEAVANGPSGDIQLETIPLKEDTAVKIKATNIKTGLGDILNTQPEIKVNPDTALIAALTSPVPYNGQAVIKLDNTQQSADYQLRLDDVDDDAADKTQLKNTATGNAVPGTGGTIELATGPLQEDITVSILATKKPSGISKALSVKIFIPVKPDPAKPLSIVKDTTESGRNTVISSVARGESAVIKVAGTQKGVLYQLRAGNTNIGMPGYHHKNYGIGRARVNIELAIGPFSGDSVYLPTGPLQKTTAFSVLAIKATTRQEALVTGTITVKVDNA